MDGGMLVVAGRAAGWDDADWEANVEFEEARQWKART
jgi:hypothetical protein